jgi:hypothetical protein
MATVQEWLALGDRLHAKGVDVFNGSEVMESAAGARDPKVGGPDSAGAHARPLPGGSASPREQARG